MPIGAVVLVDGALVARAGNRRERDGDPTAHAEVLALRAAAAQRGTWRLDGATLVVTLEPCPMCAGALLAARVARVVFGAANTDNGACGTLYNLCADPRLNHEVEVVHGVRAEAAAALLDASSPTAAADRRRSRAGPADNVAGGELPERTNGTVSKTVVAFGSPWVRIPRSPPRRRSRVRCSVRNLSAHRSRLGQRRGTRGRATVPGWTTALDAAASLGVSVLHWPADAHVREHLAAFRQPRILLVEPGVRPPALLDELEDWVRAPADPADLRARSRELHRRALDAAPAVAHDRRRRACCGWAVVGGPHAGAGAGGRRSSWSTSSGWCATTSVGATYERAGGSSHAASLRTLLTRIGARVRPVGLELVTVRRRGVLLTQRPRVADGLARARARRGAAEAAPAGDGTGAHEVADPVDLLRAELGAVLVGDLEAVDHQAVVRR